LQTENNEVLCEMVSRRILRIKIMQALYAYFKHENSSSLNNCEKELLFSIQKTYDLYHYLFLLITEVADYAQTRIDIAKSKKIPLYEDLHPNIRFVENKVIEDIRTNPDLCNYLAHKKLSWVNYPELVKGLYNEIVATEEYKKYMKEDAKSYSGDKSFLCFIYKNVISRYEPLYSDLEEQSIYWNDEVEFIIGIIIKTIKKFNDDEESRKLLPLFKNKEDEDFSKILLRKVVLNHTTYSDLIKKYSMNWDLERIAFLDILLMQMAIAEVLEFSSIPVKVTLNEYLELSKYYSTDKSSVFINGILDKVFEELKNTNQINKQGRGLIGEIG
jgi:transcription antitermination protein NusB